MVDPTQPPGRLPRAVAAITGLYRSAKALHRRCRLAGMRRRSRRRWYDGNGPK